MSRSLSPLSRLRQAERNAEKRGIEWSLTDAHLVELLGRANGRCEISGVPFAAEGAAGRNPWSMSLDRVDSRRGYVPGNVRLVAMVVNYALHEFGDATFFRMVKAVAERHGLTKAEGPLPEREELHALAARLASVEQRQEVPAQRPAINPGVLGARTHVSTSEAAAMLGRRPQTLRGWACGGVGPVKPTRMYGRLAWAVSDITRVLSEGA